MSDDDDVKVAAALLLGAVGVGLGVAALSAYEKRKHFKDALRDSVAQMRATLINAELGREHGGAPVWYLTIEQPLVGVRVYAAEFPSGVDPYAPATFGELLRRIQHVLGQAVA